MTSSVNSTDNNILRDDDAITSEVNDCNNVSKKNSKKAPFRGFGMFCALMSAVMYAVNTLLVKLTQSVGGIQLSASRCVVQTILLLPYVTYNWRYKSIDILGKKGMFKFLLLRALTGSTASMLLYQTIVYIPLGDAVTLQMTNVIFVGFLAWIALGEALTAIDVVMSLIAVAGIVLISKPSFIFGVSPDESFNSLGLLLGLCSGLLTAATVVLLRKLGKKTHPSLNIFYYSLVGSTSTSIIIMSSGSFHLPCIQDIPAIFLLGITGIIAQVFRTWALQHERAATVPVVRSFQIVIVYIMQVTVLDDVPSLLSVIGSSLIFLSVLVIGGRKLYNTIKRDKNKDS